MRLLKTSRLVFVSMRPGQWIKNLFVFAPAVFSGNILQLDSLLTGLAAFVLFSMVTGSIYIFNDIIDLPEDRNHPIKKNRPLASGRLSSRLAGFCAFVLMLAALTAIGLFQLNFLYITLLYIAVNLLYSLALKKIVILDVMLIAAGFVMRILIGGFVNDIVLSPWILAITFLLSIFLALVKRRQEVVWVQQNSFSSTTRSTLKFYNRAFLDQLIAVSTATTLISYMMYVVDPGIQTKYHTDKLIYTIPFVIFGIFRYLYLAYVMEKGECPEETILHDLPFMVNLVVWLGVFTWIIYV